MANNYGSGTGYAPYSSGAVATTTSIGVGTSPAGLVQQAYDRLLEFGLRAAPLFRTLADKKPAQQAMPGSSVVFQIYQDLDPQTATLTETSDVGFVSPGSPSSVVVTLNEYGNSVVVTRKLELLSLSDVDPALANQVAWNCVDSVDAIVRAVLDGAAAATNVWGTSGTGSTTVTVNPTVSSIPTTSLISSQAVRFINAKMRTASVVPRRGTLTACYIHPEVSVDLRAESGAGSWRESHIYAAPDVIWPGEIGTYEGSYFIESPRCTNSQAGSGSGGTQTRVFNTYFAGQQALAEGVAVEPGIVQGPVTDRLGRFKPLGWYMMAGWSLYRTVALNIVKTSSSVHPQA
jgi:N4-gp56 family major capsid protein